MRPRIYTIMLCMGMGRQSLTGPGQAAQKGLHCGWSDTQMIRKNLKYSKRVVKGALNCDKKSIEKLLKMLYTIQRICVVDITKISYYNIIFRIQIII